MIYHSLADLVGHTPIVAAQGLFLKLEQYNPSGSVKDRAVRSMLEGMRSRGELHPGDTIVEPTSGNTGIALAMLGSHYGVHVILVMPDTMSIERRQVMAAYGAEVRLTPGVQGMAGAIALAQQLVREHGYKMLDQFNNVDNRLAHQTTAEEIIADMPALDIVVAGIGTGGTISGIAPFLKARYPHVQIIGVEPMESPVITQGSKGPHGIQGIGAGFVPTILQLDGVDSIETVDTASALSTMQNYAKLGFFLGISSGAAIHVAERLLAKQPHAIILVIAPDGGLKYLSKGYASLS